MEDFKANIVNDASMNWVRGKVPANVNDPDTYKAARGFESYFARYLLNQMNGAANLMGGKGFGGEIYQGMYVEAIGEQIASSGALGITDLIYRQMMENKGIEPYKNLNGGDDTLVKPNHRYHDLIAEASEKYEVDENLIMAVIQQESAGNKHAVSHAGAKGLMQLIDSTAAEMGVQNPFNPRENIMGGTKYLRMQLDEFKDVKLALAAYNAGPTAVKKYGGIPPYKETIDYVKKVTSNLEKLKESRKEIAQTRQAIEDLAKVQDFMNRLSQRPNIRGNDGA
jgi:Rod binding domain-containing protein